MPFCKKVLYNVNNYHLLWLYHIVAALYILPLILTTILHGKYYYVRITNEEMNRGSEGRVTSLKHQLIMYICLTVKPALSCRIRLFSLFR